MTDEQFDVLLVVLRDGLASIAAAVIEHQVAPPAEPARAPKTSPLPEREPPDIAAPCPAFNRPGDAFIWYLQQPEHGPEALTLREMTPGIERLCETHNTPFTAQQISGVPIGLQKMRRRDEVVVLGGKPQRYRAADTRPDVLLAPARIEPTQSIVDFVADHAAWLDTEIRDSPWHHLADSVLQEVMSNVTILDSPHNDEDAWMPFRDNVARALTSDYHWRKQIIEDRLVWLIDD